VDAGDCRDIHHAAVLIGYGAGVVCPWLALETASLFVGEKGHPEGVDGEKMMMKALDAGIAKVMSKMGISVVNSYRGAYLFDILGLHASVVNKCFPGTPAPLSGIGFAEIDRRVRVSWIPAHVPTRDDETVVNGPLKAAELPDFGWVRFRKSDISEPHQWQPPNVKALQTVVGSARGVAAATDPAGAFAIFSRNVAMGEAAVLRDLLEILPAGPELRVEDVEAPESLCKKFISSAMSLGSLSPEAHSTITQAMNMMGARSNTGEGGEDPEVYRPQGSGSRAHDLEGGSAAVA